LGGLPLDDPGRAADRLHALAEIGVTRLVTGARYDADPTPFMITVEQLAAVRAAL